MDCNVRRSNNDEISSNRPQSTGLANKPVWTQSGTSDQCGMVLHLASSRPSLMSRQSMAGAGCLHPVAENHVQEGQFGERVEMMQTFCLLMQTFCLLIL